MATNVIVFNGTPYCAATIAATAARLQRFDVAEVIVPLTVEPGPLTVYQFEGRYHLLMGVPSGNHFEAKVLSKHQLKHARLDDVKLRKTGAAHHQEQPEVTWRRPSMNRPYEGRRY